MRIAFVLAFVAFVPGARAQCHGGSAVAALQGLAAGLQLSVASSQMTVALQQLQRSEAACSHDSDCHGGYVCSHQQCIQPVAGAQDQRSQSVELFLRARAIELREELALGRGPVIDGLAGAQGKPPAELGKVLKTHRAELRVLIGDGSDPAWPARFIRRAEELTPLPNGALACAASP